MNEKVIGRWEAQVKKGILDLIILLLLKEKTQYGYELIGLIKDKVGYEVAEGTVYPLLIRLKDDGLIESRWEEMATGIPRKYYKITPAGSVALKAMKVYWTELSANIKKLIN